MTPGLLAAHEHQQVHLRVPHQGIAHCGSVAEEQVDGTWRQMAKYFLDEQPGGQRRLF